MKAVNHLFILDGSSSMEGIKNQIIELFNSQVRLIREEAEKSDIPSFISLVVFGEKESYFKTKLMLSPPKELSFLSVETYKPYGSTPLYDAIGKGLKETEDALKYYFYSTDVIVNIFTDGEENASVSYTGNQISTLIKEYREDYSWVFNYFGANHDVEEFAKKHNIEVKNSINYVADAAGVLEASESLSSMTSSYYFNKK